MQSVLNQAQQAKQAANILRQSSSKKKNDFLNILANLIVERADQILEANQRDLQAAQGFNSSMIRRLTLSRQSILAMAESVRQVLALPDPVGEIIKSTVRPNGLTINKVRTPIGVIACIFESRPNVLIDVAALCVKSGNAVIVRGGKEAQHSNDYLTSLVTAALNQSGLPGASVQQLDDRRHEAVGELVQLDKYLDLVIPRGREELIRSVKEKSLVPVLSHEKGLCHMYIDSEADIAQAIKIAINAKTSNPATCNSIETILVHREIADQVMPELLEKLLTKGVEVHGCPRTCVYNTSCLPAKDEDWLTEYLDLIVSIKIVDAFDEAISHIQKYSSGLSDSIITEDKKAADKFISAVDSAVVLVNASNRLTDGGVFGLGAELGISTSKIHMRGPMGLEDLTVTRYVVLGNGQIRE